MSIWSKVKQFHKAFHLVIGEKAELPDFIDKHELVAHFRTTQQALEIASSNEAVQGFSLRSLRIRLLLEEVAEYLEAELSEDLEGIADALTDIHYIAAGTEVAYGIPGEEIFNHVHANNMSKLGPAGVPIYRTDGKVLKPDGWVPPQIKQFLNTS